MLQRRDVGLLGAKADGRGFGEPVASHQYHHVPLCPIICQQHSAKIFATIVLHVGVCT